jgi:hypothetical protein
MTAVARVRCCDDNEHRPMMRSDTRPRPRCIIPLVPPARHREAAAKIQRPAVQGWGAKHAFVRTATSKHPEQTTRPVLWIGSPVRKWRIGVILFGGFNCHVVVKKSMHPMTSSSAGNRSALT